MGYTTTFDGEIKVDPPLNPEEIDFLTRFANSRRMDTSAGPYHADPDAGGGYKGQSVADDIKIIDYNHPPAGQPGLWCQWVPNEDGTAIEWDQGEKFYESEAWMEYLIVHFLSPDAKAMGEPGFEGFTFNHTLNGTIDAEGEESGDLWRLVVKDNVVSTLDGHVTYDSPAAPAQPGHIVIRPTGATDPHSELEDGLWVLGIDRGDGTVEIPGEIVVVGEAVQADV